MSENGRVTVAVSTETVDRDDRCVRCDSAMLYNVRDGEVRYSFCPNYYCGLWLLPVGGHATPEYADGRV